MLICFYARHRSQAALQIKLVISSDMMAGMVGETGGQRVGSIRHHRRNMWGLWCKYNSKHLIIPRGLYWIHLTQLWGVKCYKSISFKTVKPNNKPFSTINFLRLYSIDMRHYTNDALMSELPCYLTTIMLWCSQGNFAITVYFTCSLYFAWIGHIYWCELGYSALSFITANKNVVFYIVCCTMEGSRWYFWLLETEIEAFSSFFWWKYYLKMTFHLKVWDYIYKHRMAGLVSTQDPPAQLQSRRGKK